MYEKDTNSNMHEFHAKLRAILIWFSCEYHTVKIPRDIHAKLFIQYFILVSCIYHTFFRVIIIQNIVQLNLIILKSSMISFYPNLRIKSHIGKKAEVLIGMLDEELTENNDDDLYRIIFFIPIRAKFKHLLFPLLYQACCFINLQKNYIMQCT